MVPETWTAPHSQETIGSDISQMIFKVSSSSSPEAKSQYSQAMRFLFRKQIHHLHLPVHGCGSSVWGAGSVLGSWSVLDLPLLSPAYAPLWKERRGGIFRGSRVPTPTRSHHTPCTMLGNLGTSSYGVDAGEVGLVPAWFRRIADPQVGR